MKTNEETTAEALHTMPKSRINFLKVAEEALQEDDQAQALPFERVYDDPVDYSSMFWHFASKVKTHPEHDRITQKANELLDHSLLLHRVIVDRLGARKWTGALMRWADNEEVASLRMLAIEGVLLDATDIGAEQTDVLKIASALVGQGFDDLSVEITKAEFIDALEEQGSNVTKTVESPITQHEGRPILRADNALLDYLQYAVTKSNIKKEVSAPILKSLENARKLAKERIEEIEQRKGDVATDHKTHLWWSVEHFGQVPYAIKLMARVFLVIAKDLSAGLKNNPRPKQPLRSMLKVATHKGDDYAQSSKIIRSMSWVMGGSGQRIDGDTYVEAPEAVRFMPQGLGIIPNSNRPSQQLLPMALAKDATSLSQMVSDTSQMTTGMQAKMLLFASVSAQPYKRVESTVEELTLHINPDKKRIRARDYKRTLSDFHALGSLRVCLDDGTNMGLLSVASKPSDEDPEDIRKRHVIWSFDSIFEDYILGHETIGGRTWKGYFPINLSGLMRLSGNDAMSLRQYLFAAACWNDAKQPGTGRFSKDHLPELNRDLLAAHTNALSPAAAQWIEHKSGGQSAKVQAAMDRKQTWKALQLLEEMELIVIDGTQSSFKILPPEQWQEAHKLMQKGGVRPKDY